MTSPDVAIGQLGTKAGVKVETIRYYEKIGLIPNRWAAQYATQLFHQLANDPYLVATVENRMAVAMLLLAKAPASSTSASGTRQKSGSCTRRASSC